MSRLTYLILILISATVFASCEKEVEEKPYEQNMYNFFNEYLKTICDTAATCKSGFVNGENRIDCPDIIMHYPYPFEAFKRGEKVIFMQKYEMLVIAEKRDFIKVDMIQAEKCFELIKSMSPCSPMEVHLLDVPECVEVFEGTKSLRQECGQDEECYYGWCNLPSGRCPGTCVDYREPGQNCNPNLDKCAPGYTCRSSGCSKSTIGKIGEPCLTDVDCSSFLYCGRQNENDATGTCFKRQDVGEVCFDQNECMSGLDCINNLCSKERVSSVAGGKCGMAQNEEEEEVLFSCNLFSKLECNEQNTCRKFSGQGQPCSEMCEKNLFCDQRSGVCQYQSLAGRSCEDGIECISFYCLNGVCSVPECIDVQ